MSITLILVIITVGISYMGFQDRSLFNKMKHYPVAEHGNKEWYRLLTCGFLHGSWLHLGINMYVFYEFGQWVEQYYLAMFGDLKGRILYLVVYLLIIVLANIPTFLKHKDNPSYAAIGASGAVSGILFIYILFQPWSMLGLFFIIPIPAIVFAVLYVVYSSWASKNQKDLIDHDAHLYGALWGMAITLMLRPGLFNDFIFKLTNNAPF